MGESAYIGSSNKTKEGLSAAFGAFALRVRISTNQK